MAFQEVEVGVWKPENEDDEITGILTKIESDVGANDSMLYTLEVEGKPVGVWGSAVLDIKMVAAKEKDLVKIVYLGKGEATGGKNAPKLFKVLIDYDAREGSETIPEETITDEETPHV